MRLLYASYGPQSGVTSAVVDGLAARGFQVTQYDPLPSFLFKRTLVGVQVPNVKPDVVHAVVTAAAQHGRSWKNFYLHTCYAFDRLSERVAAAIDRSEPDCVLQAGALFAPGQPPAARYYLYLDNTKAIGERQATRRGLPPPMRFDHRWRARETSVYRNAEAIFVMSQHVARSLATDYGVDCGRIHVVGAGPNITPDDPRALGAPREPWFVFVGGEFVRKGGLTLLSAFAEVKRTHPRAELLIASAYRPGRAPDGVHTLGLVDRSALAALFGRASAFVLPTLREPFGLSYLEAMSFALPCIGTPVEAVPEIIVDGKTGLLVPPGNEAALARAMRQLLDDPARARQMGLAGRARVAARFGWDRACDAMAAVIRSSARARGSASPAASAVTR